MVTIRRRISNPKLREYLTLASLFMLLLFLLRLSKYLASFDEEWMNQFLWYSYYVPMTAVPLCFY